MNPTCDARLASESDLPNNALTAAAIRELWEETGQILGRAGDWDNPPSDWQDFAKTGHMPDPSVLSFFFRAVTPVGRPRRFDARFFLTDAAHLKTDPDDFSNAEDELSHLQWVPLSEARAFDLPFITKVVLAELVAHIDRDGPIQSVPFFRNDDEAHLVTRLNGADLL
jgi:8-oxo-dGTP pyrophosphatase MutT (NUDIX family)